ncbi:hypothetical protein R6Q59_018823 [Mikania micrantha]
MLSITTVPNIHQQPHHHQFFSRGDDQEPSTTASMYVFTISLLLLQILRQKSRTRDHQLLQQRTDRLTRVKGRGTFST